MHLPNVTVMVGHILSLEVCPMPLPPVSHDLNTKDGKLQISGEAVHSSVSAMHKTVAKVKKKETVLIRRVI